MRDRPGHGLEYLKRAQAAGLTWPLPEDWDDRRLEEALFGPSVRRLYESQKPTPDFARLHEELQRQPHLTLQLAWEEYRQAHPEGYGYSRFCELYQNWRQRLDVVLRQEHPAGEKLFVDFAGATIPIHDPQGGPVREASLFVAVLGASNYTYAEATWSQGLEDWIGAHIRTFEFLGGVAKLVVPDNTRSGVSRACRYSGAPGSSEPAAFPQAPRLPGQPLRGTGPARLATAARRALRASRVVHGSRQHRLSH